MNVKAANAKQSLNPIIENLGSLYRGKDLSRFYARLGAHFEDLFKSYQRIYGDRDDFQEELDALVRSLAVLALERPDYLKELDNEREGNPAWILGPEWVATMLYVDRYSGNLKGFMEKVEYLKDLGVNYVHLMPLLESPEGENDGGYAVKDYRAVDSRFGSMEDLRSVAKLLRENGMLLELDLVLNHTSDEHEWARRALSGEKKYQDYYYMYDDRAVPDEFEKTLPEVFPELAPGNFTWRDEIKKWVFTVFNRYQWDLNYTNPRVLREMAEILLFVANQGVDVLRLDAVAFLWKRLGTNSQNEQEAHFILQVFKACAKIAAPGAVFKAEAIVQPAEIVKYLGEGDAAGKECEVAYNASYMVFLWDAIATKNARLLQKGLENMPRLPRGTTWVNYVRCHDDIGLGFSDLDAVQVGYDPKLHRKFLVDYYTGEFPGSMASGERFMYNPKTGDSRISGSLASLAGLERAVREGNAEETEKALRRILLLHAAIMGFGGIPLVYYGDELATTNDRTYLRDPSKKDDNRWMHRPVMDWKAAERRNKEGTIEHRIFQGLKEMIAVRKASPEFHGENDYILLANGNTRVFSFLRERGDLKTVTLLNFSDETQYVEMNVFYRAGMSGTLCDKITGMPPAMRAGHIEMEPYAYYWLTDTGKE